MITQQITQQKIIDRSFGRNEETHHVVFRFVGQKTEIDIEEYSKTNSITFANYDGYINLYCTGEKLRKLRDTFSHLGNFQKLPDKFNDCTRALNELVGTGWLQSDSKCQSDLRLMMEDKS